MCCRLAPETRRPPPRTKATREIETVTSRTVLAVRGVRPIVVRVREEIDLKPN